MSVRFWCIVFQFLISVSEEASNTSRNFSFVLGEIALLNYWGRPISRAASAYGYWFFSVVLSQFHSLTTILQLFSYHKILLHLTCGRKYATGIFNINMLKQDTNAVQNGQISGVVRDYGRC